MKILSQNQLQDIQNDLAALLKKYDLTSGYMVVERKPEANEPGDFVTVVNARVNGYKMSPMINTIGAQTHQILLGLGIQKAPIITDN